MSKKYIIKEKQADGTLNDLLVGTSADLVQETEEKKVLTKEERETITTVKEKLDNNDFGKVDDVKDVEGNSLVVNKVATLKDYAIKVNGKIQLSDLPDNILGQVLYSGTINQSGVATLSQAFKDKYNVESDTLQLDSTSANQCEGAYFIAQDTTTFTNVTILGVANVSTGDWIISNGINWTKVDNSDAVVSVNGKTGAVILTKTDIGLGNVDNTADANKNVNSASKLTNAKTFQLTGDITGSATTDLSTGMSISTTLKDSGVSAGTYSAVQVNSKGLVTNGKQVIEVGTTGQTTPSDNLVVGGLFFKEVE